MYKGSAPSWIPIGKFVKLHGLEGKVIVMTDAKEESILRTASSIGVESTSLEDKGTFEPLSIRERSWMPKKGWLLSLEDINDVARARSLLGKQCAVTQEIYEASNPPTSNEYLVSSLIGAKVYEGSKEVGVLVGCEMIEAPRGKHLNEARQDRWWIETSHGLVPVPSVPHYISSVDIKEKKIVLAHWDELVLISKA